MLGTLHDLFDHLAQCLLHDLHSGQQAARVAGSANYVGRQVACGDAPGDLHGFLRIARRSS